MESHENSKEEIQEEIKKINLKKIKNLKKKLKNWLF